ncbi:hypothetical protein AaE_012575 [Aphanomyces astaci]|uniref:Beta-hexosaminidase n=1 Tax=Aphanomyces astaci TaxID=112090 RepID=A0A6A4Z7Q5_APHAT|nr:hypothetical protein AaE_012575 [Aphanomyces astaci]
MKATFLIAPLATATAAIEVRQHRYSCVKNNCVLQPLTSDNVAGTTSLNVCELTCGQGSLWPQPTSVSIGQDTVAISTWSANHRIVFEGKPAYDVTPLVSSFKSAFSDALKFKAKEGNGKDIEITANIKSASEVLDLNTDESYDLSVDGIKVTINAATLFGYRHALTTLSQLVEFDEFSNTVRLVSKVTIKDSPAYKNRGITVDTARNFYSVESLKRIIRTMGGNKLNTFHWHISDSNAFPVESKTYPNLTAYGSYTAKQVYTQADIRDIVKYAKTYGVRVVPELDAPAHAGSGWEWGPAAGLGELTLCYGANPWFESCVQPPCGQLNPLNDNVYKVLEGLHNEWLSLFDSDVFHMGGDEVHVGCWNQSVAVYPFVKDRHDPKSFFHLWGEFQVRSAKVIEKAQKKVMLWSSDLTTPDFYKYLPTNNTIVHIWSDYAGGDTKRLTDAGYEVVLSYWDAHYLDCGFGGWVNKGNGWCNPYKTWQVIYDTDIVPNVTAANQKLVLGAQVALWAEMADTVSGDFKIWPRASALAERLWSNPTTTWKDAMSRYRTHRDRLVAEGVNIAPIHPEWCRQNPTECTLV